MTSHYCWSLYLSHYYWFRASLLNLLAAESFSDCCFSLTLGLFAKVPSKVEPFVTVGCLGHYSCPCCYGQSVWFCSELVTTNTLVAGVTLFSVISCLLHCNPFRFDSIEHEPGAWKALSQYCCFCEMAESWKTRVEYKKEKEAARQCFLSWHRKVPAQASSQLQIYCFLSFSCLETLKYLLLNGLFDLSFYNIKLILKLT